MKNRMRVSRALSRDALGRGTKHHSELLKPFGLDARDPKFWQGGLSVIERMIGSWKRSTATVTIPSAATLLRRRACLDCLRPTARKPFSARAARYASVDEHGRRGGEFAASRLFGLLNRGKNASELAVALGGRKGRHEGRQLMATIPDLLPPEYVEDCKSCRAKRRRWAGRS